MKSVGIFTSQIEKELLAGNIDIAVHSAKDLPSWDTNALKIAAVPERGYCEDVLVSRADRPLDKLATGSVIGTGSVRRQAMLLHFRPDLIVKNIRGNIETRLKKVQNGEYDAIILAHSGLNRLGMEDRIIEMLPCEKFLPAPGQGALAVQCRQDDKTIDDMLKSINHPASFRCLKIERLLLRKLNAGCSMAIGGLAKYDNDQIKLEAVVLDKSGKNRLFASYAIAPDQPDELLVDQVTDKLMEQGAEKLIEVYGKEEG
jgi:hydroxymethylbilane synthase